LIGVRIREERGEDRSEVWLGDTQIVEQPGNDKVGGYDGERDRYTTRQSKRELQLHRIRGPAWNDQGLVESGKHTTIDAPADRA
jgi:hypothetical protein